MDTEPLHPGEYVMYLRKSRADIEKEARGEMETLGKHERELVSMSKRMGIVVADIRRELVSGEKINWSAEGTMTEFIDKPVTNVYSRW